MRRRSVSSAKYRPDAARGSRLYTAAGTGDKPPMSTQFCAGLTTSSHQKTNLSQATLDKVAVTKN